MQMQVYKAWRDKISGRIDLFGPLAAEIGTNVRDSILFDRDINELLMTTDTGISNDEVHWRSNSDTSELSQEAFAGPRIVFLPRRLKRVRGCADPDYDQSGI
jgi:hypothetical protein